MTVGRMGTILAHRRRGRDCTMQNYLATFGAWVTINRRDLRDCRSAVPRRYRRRAGARLCKPLEQEPAEGRRGRDGKSDASCPPSAKIAHGSFSLTPESEHDLAHAVARRNQRPARSAVPQALAVAAVAYGLPRHTGRPWPSGLCGSARSCARRFWRIRLLRKGSWENRVSLCVRRARSRYAGGARCC